MGDKNQDIVHISVNLNSILIMIIFTTIGFAIVYYKFWDSNWRENDYNWSCFYSNEILCMVWGVNRIQFKIINIILR